MTVGSLPQALLRPRAPSRFTLRRPAGLTYVYPFQNLKTRCILGIVVDIVAEIDEIVNGPCWHVPAVHFTVREHQRQRLLNHHVLFSAGNYA